MSIPGSAEPLLLAQQDTGYKIERSIRLNSADSAFLSRTPASAGNRKTWTWAGWVKRTALTATNALFAANSGTNPWGVIWFRHYDGGTGNIDVDFEAGVSPTSGVRTTATFRDPSAWYHIVVAVDTTQATASNRVKIYVNGTQQAISTTWWPSQNFDTQINSTSTHYIGQDFGHGGSSNDWFNGLLADVFFIDGQALTPSSFGEFSATTGRWEPKKYSGPTPTGNSFWLPFSDNSAATATTLGKDGFLLGNNWTCNNVVVTLGSSDANASSLVLAVPMDGANNGTTFTDLSATIKGSGSAKTITANSAITSTSQSRFYGSSGYLSNNAMRVNASADFEFPGDFTIEFWVYKVGYNRFATPLMINPDTGQLVSINMGNSITGWLFAVGNSDYAATNTFTASTWTHLAMCRSGGTVYCFINGQLAGTFSSSGTVGSSTQQPYIGDYRGDNQYSFNGWIQDLRIYKGVAKYTSSFSLPGPLKGYSAADVDSTVDTPSSAGTDTGVGGQVTGNYATLNPLSSPGYTYSNGNLDVSGSTPSTYAPATIALPLSGKFYFEYTCTNTAGSNRRDGVGVVDLSKPKSYLSNVANTVVYHSFDGNVYQNNTALANYGTWTNGDVCQCAIDCDTGKVWFGKNGTFTGSPSAGTGQATALTNNGNLTFAVCSQDNTGSPFSISGSVNFGQRSWAYAAPSGFRPLVDTLLPAPVIAKPSTVMDVLLWTGNGSNPRSLTGLNFSPDLVWIKGRQNMPDGYPYDHTLFDTVRGASKDLRSNGTGSETTNNGYGYLDQFDSAGFRVTNGSTDDYYVNEPNKTYVAWTWDAGTTTSSNGSGSITSQVRANPSAGFSIATFTKIGNTNETIGHGLGVAPSMVIVKTRQSGGYTGWAVYHASTGANGYLELNTTSAFITLSSTWNNTAPTSTVFTMGTGWTSTQDMVAYCFAPVAGYSSFGSYTGNGSTDGPFVFCNFRPRWVMIKQSSASGENWIIYDAAREPANVAKTQLFPNLSNAEFVSGTSPNGHLDMLSNGFKCRETTGGTNGSGATYIYAAFAESPFQYARAR